MLIGGILLGLVLGLLAGGSIGNLARVQLRWVGVLLIAVILRFATEFLLARGVAIVDTLRLPLFAIAFGMLLAGLWVNRTHPGLRLAFVGILLNTIAILANGGRMPIWEPSLTAAGFTTADLTPFHVLLTGPLSLDFLLHAGPLADILPIPLPVVQNVLSIGDVFLTAGLAFFLFASVVRPTGEADDEWTPEDQPLSGLASTSRLPRSVASAIGGQRARPGTGLATGLAETAALEHPLLLGTPGTGMAGPSATRGDYGGYGAADVGGNVAATAAAAFGGRGVALAPVPAAGS